MIVVIEGIDGAGKTTIAKALVKELKRRGYDVIYLREPTDSEWGRRIREARNLSPKEELELFLKDREWDVKHNILPALKDGKIVVMDRYYHSTIAYQGAKGIDPNYIRKLNERFPKPDLVVVLDVRPETALGRIKKRGKEPDEFEKLEYLRRVRDIYLSMGDVILVNAERSLDDVLKDLLSLVLEKLRFHASNRSDT